MGSFIIKAASSKKSQAGVSEPRPVAPRTCTCAHGRAARTAAQVRRAWEPGDYRSAEVAVLEFRGWHVGARSHWEKENLRAVLQVLSGSELVSLSDRILVVLVLPPVACSLRPRVRVKRACQCALGIARRGAQIGSLRLGAPCKAGGYCWPLTRRCRSRRAPQIRAIGDPIGRAAPPHERSQPRTAPGPGKMGLPGSGYLVSKRHRAEPASRASGALGRMLLGGRARWACTISTVAVERSGI